MQTFREWLREKELNENNPKLIATYMRKYINKDKAYYLGHNKVIVLKDYSDEVRKDLEDMLSKNMLVAAKGKDAVKMVYFSNSNEVSSILDANSNIVIPEKQ